MKKINLKHLGRNISGLILPLLLLVFISSCSKMDEYKKYIEGGEISYTGKVDSVRIFSGKDRVLVKGLLKSDPKVKKTVIYWNNMTDSVIVPINRTSSVDTLKFFIDNISEGVQNFTLYTYDEVGNRSIPVYVTGRVYGNRYQNSLSNRGISSTVTSGVGSTTIDWSGMDRLSGVFATEVIYLNTNGEEQKIRIPIDVNQTLITNLNSTSSSFKYRTLFLPDTVSVDTFYTSFVEKKIELINLTSRYLKNTSQPFATSSQASRWGILADWTVSASVKNASGFGSWDKNNNVIAIEGGWGLPDVPNGKIYQTITLPAGKYMFRTAIFKHGVTGAKSIAVAAGNALPNSADVAASSIAYVTLPNVDTPTSANKVVDVKFELTQEQQVSMGFVVNFINTASAGQFFNVKAVSLYQLQ